MMRPDLTTAERKVMRCFQDEGYPLLGSTVSSKTGFGEGKIMQTFASLAEKGLLDIVDRTAGELSPAGRTYDLFDGCMTDDLPIRRETEIVLASLKSDPQKRVSRKRLEAVDGLTPEEIQFAIDELDTLGFPIQGRVEP